VKIVHAVEFKFLLASFTLKYTQLIADFIEQNKQTSYKSFRPKSFQEPLFIKEQGKFSNEIQQQ